MEESEIKEGKIELTAACDGLLKVDRDRLKQINQFGQMMIASRHGNTSVKKGDKLAGMRIIPLVIEKEKMEAVKTQCGEKPILTLLPFKEKKAAILTTGNEVFYGRIKDQFIPTIEEKLSEYDAELVICTGGMSVDPDDKTPLDIKNTGAEIVSYGAPVLPGAMFLLSYYKEQVPVTGLPGCAMYARRTIFDLVLPRIMADDKITAEELGNLGEGGLCLNCEQCTYPNCGFGKGW